MVKSTEEISQNFVAFSEYIYELYQKIAGSSKQSTKPSYCNNEEVKDIKIEEYNSNLVFPCPKDSSSNYTKYASLASFVRSASDEVPLVFQKVAEKLDENLENETMSKANWYLSSTSVVSAGKITNWVHLRIDPSPKFYRYNPYIVFLDCKIDSCKNNGTCNDGVNGFSCDCEEGYKGKNCQYRSCAAKLCEHGSTCQDKADGYHCNCSPGFVGTNCEKQVYSKSFSSHLISGSLNFHSTT